MEYSCWDYSFWYYDKNVRIFPVSVSSRFLNQLGMAASLSLRIVPFLYFESEFTIFEVLTYLFEKMILNLGSDKL